MTMKDRCQQMRLQAEKATTFAHVKVMQSKLLALPCGYQAHRCISADPKLSEQKLGAPVMQEKYNLSGARLMFKKMSGLLESLNVLAMLSMDINKKLDIDSRPMAPEDKGALNQRKTEISQLINEINSTIDGLLAKIHLQIYGQVR